MLLVWWCAKTYFFSFLNFSTRFYVLLSQHFARQVVQSKIIEKTIKVEVKTWPFVFCLLNVYFYTTSCPLYLVSSVCVSVYTVYLTHVYSFSVCSTSLCIYVLTIMPLLLVLFSGYRTVCTWYMVTIVMQPNKKGIYLNHR